MLHTDTVHHHARHVPSATDSAHDDRARLRRVLQGTLVTRARFYEELRRRVDQVARTRRAA